MNPNVPQNESLERIQRLARLLDTSFRVPGTKFRFGLDALLGLLPVGGDAVTAIAGTVLIARASRLGASKGLLMRMVFNLLIDFTLGALPLVGDVFDFFWRSNSRNVKLLESHLAKKNSVGHRE
ncbi:MAG: DUF4112 domain-containing protein [Planctomycetota bacterium]